MHSEVQNELQAPAVDAPIGLTWWTVDAMVGKPSYDSNELQSPAVDTPIGLTWWTVEAIVGKPWDMTQMSYNH